jgi:hypothetical protein
LRAPIVAKATAVQCLGCLPARVGVSRQETDPDTLKAVW